jgi:hypothetical protein
VAQVLAELKVFGPSDLALIAKQFSGTVPVKKLLMIAEMAQQVRADSSTLQILFSHGTKYPC